MKISKLVWTILAAGCLSTGFVGQSANAAMINGAITFAGGAVYDTSSLATATRVNSFSNVSVMSSDGDFASFTSVGDAVTMAAPWIFTPSTATPALWSVGGFTYDLSGATVVLQNADFLLISGTGTISGNGFDPTVGTWSFTSQSPSADGMFSFSSGSSANGVPDGGTTMALLGIALVGIEIARRKLVLA
ncbi:MAG: VPDSG-CTERM sorting domain-containing protein [Chthoniobacterales bacterium]|nr:VPDSG-CTERM sorting domain-containing protein [Chthoniobacterales bacterium]